MKQIPLLEVAPLAADRVQPFEGKRFYIATGDLDDDGTLSPQVVSCASRPSRADLTVIPGDVCVARMQATTKVFQFESSHSDLILSTGFAVFRPISRRVHSRYVFHYLRTKQFQRAKDALCSGATQKAITNENLACLMIPLPPLDVQRRIVEVLDRAEELRTKRRAALAQLDALTAALFFDLFGHSPQPPVTVGDRLREHAEGWQWELLTDVADLATGHTPDRRRPDYWGGSIPWITLSEIRKLDGTIAHETAENVTEAGIKHSSAVKLPSGTVCFSRTASVGFVTVMGREMATSQDFVNWVCGPRLNPIYLMHALLRSRARLRALSTGSTHKTIYFPTVERFRILAPPLSLQEEFAHRVAAVEKLEAVHRASLAELDALFASLQYRAFRGEL